MLQETLITEGACAVAARPLELAVIVPTFNEAANVRPLLEKLSLVLAAYHWEAIFVDDNSPDGTSDLIREIGRQDIRVRIVQRIGRRGLSSAVVEGMLATSAPVLAVIDGDLQHDEQVLPRLISEVEEGGAEIAVGTRYAAGGSIGDWEENRHLASRIATSIGQFVLHTEMSDPMSGFFVIRRETLMAAMPRLSTIGFKVLLDIVASLPKPPRIAEVPYCFKSRVSGDSKADAMVAAEYLYLLADKTIGRILPIRLLTFLFVGGLGVGVHIAVLGLSLSLGIRFVSAEVVAVIAAMTFNFLLNNTFTYRDRRLRGWRMIGGLASFYAICSLGALANIGIGTWVNDLDGRWWLAGLAGVIVGAIWNFAASSFITWRK